MKRVLASALAAALAVGVFGSSAHLAPAHAQNAGMGIEILQPTGPVTVPANGKITLTVAVHGFTFDPADMSKAPKPGKGHGHFYIDRVPVGGYTSAAIAANPKNGWAGVFTSTHVVFDLKKSALKVTRGQHLLILNLAQNNHQLYRAPAAAIAINVR